MQFTVGKETETKLRRLQELLRREIPDGDPGAIFDRALTVLLKDVEAKTSPRSRAAVATPKRGHGTRRPQYAGWCRGATKGGVHSWPMTGGDAPSAPTSNITTRTPYAHGGEATVDNITLHCRAHNAYEAVRVFGAHEPSRVRERFEVYAV